MHMDKGATMTINIQLVMYTETMSLADPQYK